MRSRSLAAISADSARSNGESIAVVFTGTELNRGKSALEATCPAVFSNLRRQNRSTSRNGRVKSPDPRKVPLHLPPCRSVQRIHRLRGGNPKDKKKGGVTIGRAKI